jgi:hypothetical protein
MLWYINVKAINSTLASVTQLELFLSDIKEQILGNITHTHTHTQTYIYIFLWSSRATTKILVQNLTVCCMWNKG